MILVDSSVWIDYFKGAATPQTDLLYSLMGREGLAVGDLIMAEVLQGFAGERDFREALRYFDSLMIHASTAWRHYPEHDRLYYRDAMH